MASPAPVPGMPGGASFLGGLGSLFGGLMASRTLSRARDELQNMPGMHGPPGLYGDFGASRGGMFGFNPAMAGAQSALSGQIPGLFNYTADPRLQAAMGGLDLGAAAGGLDALLQQQIGPGNAGALGVSGDLLSSGMANLAAAGDSSALQQEELAIMRERFAPEAQRTRNQMMDRLHSMGLLGAGTNTQSQSGIVRGTEEALAGADLDFQREAFGRGMQRQQFLGSLGQQQVGAGLGAENQAFAQALQALGQNQQAGMNRLQAAQGLFGMDQDIFAQRMGLGLQGMEGLLGFGQFGLEAAGLPFQLQAALLGGSSGHAAAQAGLAQAQAEAQAGMFSGFFG